MDFLLHNEASRRLFWSSRVAESLPTASGSASGVDEDHFPKLRDFLVFTLPCAVGFTLLRILLEHLAFRPLTRRLFDTGAKKKLATAAAQLGLGEAGKAETGLKREILEQVFEITRPHMPDINRVKELNRVSNGTAKVEQINRWFRARQEVDREKLKVDRFTECLWRLGVYSFTFFFGLAALSSESWYTTASIKANSIILDEHTTNVFWEGFPLGQPINEMVRAFYVAVQLPLYLHLFLFHAFVDQRRQDFWEMSAHHLLVIVLMAFSYVGNFIRVGCVILLCHDITDLFLESSKIFNYLKMETITVITFNLFVASWAYFRMYRFPFVCMRSTFFEAAEHDVASNSALLFFNVLLSLLLLLNLYWFRLILKLWFSMMWRNPSVARATNRNGNQDSLTPSEEESTDDGGDSDTSYLSDFGEDSRMKRHED